VVQDDELPEGLGRYFDRKGIPIRPSSREIASNLIRSIKTMSIEKISVPESPLGKPRGFSVLEDDAR